MSVLISPLSVRRALARGAAALGLATVLMIAGGSVAQAKLVYMHGKAYGVLPRPSGPVSNSPLSVAGSPFTVGGPQAPMTYGGGPVMHSTKIYLIFWGPTGSFASTYSGPITQYAKDLGNDYQKITNEFSIARLYYGGAHNYISRNVSYGGAIFDKTPYPSLDTAGGCTSAQQPCVTDGQIQTEILNDINNQAWPTDPAGAPVEQYMLYTPNGVNSCMGVGSCTFTANNGYCAYHAQVTGISPGNQVATYSNMPYESGCDSGEAPAGTDHNADTDGTLDSEIHELLESATDPAGNAWLDSGGQEVGDKCTQPVVSSQADVYGTWLGGSLGGLNAYNQLIGGHTYYTQMIWAQSGTKTPSSSAPAGCIQRIGASPSFVAPSGTQHTGVTVHFSAAASTDVIYPITTYTWNYGDGSPTTSGVSGSHVYTHAGTYIVTLTVSDAGGAVNASSEQRAVVVAAPARRH